FLSYRIDALLFPVLLASIVLAVFGVDGVKRLRYPIIYTLFASPLLLIPILSLNQGFALLNANLIYTALSTLGLGLVKSGIVITAPSATSISISTTCVSLGFFVALLMFLAPVAYLYEGDNNRKYIFVAAGVLLLLILNVLRMLVLSLVWAYYGLGSAIGAVHLFAGQLLFYLSIIVMIIIASKFGLTLAKQPKRNAKIVKMKLPTPLYAGLALALLIGVISFALSVDYSASVSAPIQLTNSTAPPQQLLYSAMFSSLGASGKTVTLVGADQNATVFSLGNGGNSTANQTYVLVAQLGTTSGRLLGNYTANLGSEAELLRDGITVRSSKLLSENKTVLVSYYAMPYNISGTYAFLNYEFITLPNQSLQFCDSINGSSVESLQSSIYNFFTGGSATLLSCNAYKVASTQDRVVP
ncbi:MAG: exosortase/archaeosortase family protein, partial [Candidatus Micrarchaeota archaeon]|nr:exosortase/archaeosortase family protein [Candidatus Micrarchaeota archaeon]